VSSGGWSSLGDVCDVSRGTNITRKRATEGEVPVVAGGLKPTYYHNQANRSGQIITISGSGANAGFVNYYDIPIWASDCTTVLPKQGDQLLVKFVYLFLKSKQKHINEELRQGSAQPHVYPRDISKLPIPVPSVVEQERIIAILDEAFSSISEATRGTKTSLRHAREIFDSRIMSLFSDSAKWTSAPVSELVSSGVIAKPQDGNHGEIHPKKADFVSSGVPFIMAAHLVDGIVDQKNCHFISESQANSLRVGFARTGDVLISHKGTIGRVAILETSRDYVVLTPQVTYYRIEDQTALSNRYLYYFFQNPKFQKEMKKITSGGSTRAYIGITKQRELKIEYPELDEQLLIADALNSLEVETRRLESIYLAKLAALTELRQSVLQKAFSGELAGEPDKVLAETGL
jgi:type I restriction enzyme, S subunit